MTLKETLSFGVGTLVNSGIDEAEIDAWLLLEFVSGIGRTEYYMYPDRELDFNVCEKYKQLILKRSNHYPLQYITNVQQFMGYDFYVDESVLVPRPETELLVVKTEKVISEKKKCLLNNQSVKVLDMCTGSGCIAISLKLRNYELSVSAVDISNLALEVARKNAEILSADVCFIQSDLFENVSCEKYDIIVSNPPYIETGELAELMIEVRDYEPVIALDGKNDGLYFYRKIIKESVSFLKPDGVLILEIGFNQADSVSLLLENAGFKTVEVIQDMSGLNRIVVGGI